MVELKSNDYVGISFWLISISLAATTGFLVVERPSIEKKWQTPTTVGALVTGIAAVHYFYMRTLWVKNRSSPVVYRYIDWFLTVPLQIIEFYLILSVATKIPSEIFYKLLGAAIVMLVAGFLGETGMINRMLGFTIGTFAWLYIVYEIFFGETAQYKNETTDKSVIFAFDALKYIVTIGWAIYPIGYMAGTDGWYSGLFGFLDGQMDVIYNIGDAVNKIGFGLVVYNLAVSK